MAINTYAVPPNFPNGLNLDTLIREMRGVWPVDLHGSDYMHRGGKPGAAVGMLTIETPRGLTAQENAAALAHFQTHVAAKSAGILLDELPPGATIPGAVVYVADAPRMPGPNASGLGTVLYSDGTVWRRVSDDEVTV